MIIISFDFGKVDFQAVSLVRGLAKGRGLRPEGRRGGLGREQSGLWMSMVVDHGWTWWTLNYGWTTDRKYAHLAQPGPHNCQ